MSDTALPRIPDRRRPIPAGRFSFISTITIFGTPVDVTLSELAIEAFFPADEESAGRLHAAWRG